LGIIFLKILGIALGCTLKPVIAIPASVAAGAEFYQTILGGIIGGCFGITVYLYSLDYLLKTYKKHLHNKKQHEIIETPVKKKPIFTKRNRMIVRLMQKYGLNGIAVLTPLLSLPLGVFIAGRINDKFIQNRKKVLLYLCTSMVIWTFVLTGVSHLF
jgi:MFS family permease